MDEFTQPPKVLGDLCKGIEDRSGILAKQVRFKTSGPEGSVGDLKIIWKLIFEIHSDPANMLFGMEKAEHINKRTTCQP